ncbi:tRNA (5-methylaminomethyl-2-thiouridine)(34)-methyltransferase MnmD [Aequorivita lipolytica]|uniref:tRNA (5-methylaminomethyl-2-thiouridine)(34)-methyltransferase MnmD n=1 Tax=Aequorivita lipolytica TaxID=153267 RepID=A0A5C6YNX0_9FLAO|nr:tRNA (5-methylaminomethyl-2-thiouridine)(34)-methyltransferase MnmD [Aequorivita lipolytica]TXD68721.1 tRNA (5-methylaminomethyl-2-thiouridine)(34)-methyltransferase MnmD [Aequorivita lipolytica]SRX53136.1 tRNA 5-methylaminomethyl-2-thiouridine biosynthesis bifunctional protein MnmC [Aequorivita lipolytica]
MKRTLFKTDDGSYSLHIPEWDEQYHSKHGAIAEALHVFIKEGLYHWIAENKASEVSILEIGFGTGLNAFLTFLETEKKSFNVDYTGVEAYPLEMDEINMLNYTMLLNASEEKFLQLHNVPWEEKSTISKNFQLTKQQKFFSEINSENCFNLIYFDAFGIRVQPELWTEEIFRKMHTALKPNGVLVTYAANGNARRALQSVGFKVARLPGPPGKREMLRGTK